MDQLQKRVWRRFLYWFLLVSETGLVPAQIPQPSAPCSEDAMPTQLSFLDTRMPLERQTLAMLRGMRADAEGNLFLLAGGRERILQYRTDGSVFRLDDTRCATIDDVVISGGEARLIGHSSSPHLILFYDPSGELLGSVRIDAYPPGLGPRVVHFNSDGTVVLYPGASVGTLLSVLTPDGRVLRSFGKEEDAGPARRPFFVCDSEDSIFVFRQNLPTFLKFSADDGTVETRELELLDFHRELLAKNGYFPGNTKVDHYVPLVLDAAPDPEGGLYVLLSGSFLEHLNPDGVFEQLLKLRKAAIQFTVGPDRTLYSSWATLHATVDVFPIESLELWKDGK